MLLLFCNQENCFFKYVEKNESDIPEIKKFVTKYNIPENRVQLMTQASTKEEISMKEKSISELAKLHNFSFSQDYMLQCGAHNVENDYNQRKLGF